MIQSLEIKSKSKEDAISKALTKFNAKREDIEVEVIENPSKGFLGLIGAKDGVFKITLVEKSEQAKVKSVADTEGEVAVSGVEKKSEIEISKNFVEGILKNSNIDAEVKVVQEGNLIKIDIVGKEASSLIGRRGETLDSIQLLTGLALNKINKDSKMRVLIDIGNYRKKRKESLVRYANKVAREVAKTKKTKKLDYMNPYERRIIHSALQNDKYVITYSEGTDPYRRLVIECKEQ
ncbi:protein jag [Clostridioides mangenotii]|uniref:RNA-binding cell elongation regulator Jag/EloR n=1 Tax=Metaclostridioides mangenotii TaxID=1540 RepID=UPI001C0F3D41|nr:RNA-binding cell elongation regulator Jag/EloR [Clostridioides mangenotii]MBU5308685.1 protein jag [Clostridioides mangenotii]MCR1955051.1 protein jag [Clostridioides mangenotii]